MQKHLITETAFCFVLAYKLCTVDVFNHQATAWFFKE